MTNEMKFTDVGEGLTEGKVLEIKVSKGDFVEIDDILMEIETDKAIVDIPSNFKGKIEEIKVSEGETINVGETIIKYKEQTSDKDKNTDSVIGTNIQEEKPEQENNKFIPIKNNIPTSYHIEEDIQDLKKWWKKEGQGEKINKEDIKKYSLNRINKTESQEINSLKEKTPCTPKARRTALEEGVLVDKVHKNTSGIVTQKDIYQYLLSKTQNKTTNNKQNSTKIKATPKARKLSSELNIPLSEITKPSGNYNEQTFITHNDVKKHQQNKNTTQQNNQKETNQKTIDYTGIRKNIGNNMENSYRNKPHTHHQDYVDATNLLKFKKQINKNNNITITPILTKICSRALQEHPIFNSKLDKENQQIILQNQINIGIATDTQEGLKVPVVTKTNQKYIKEINKEINQLAEKCKNGNIKPENFQNHTFTITNIGVIGGTYSTPIINGDDVAIIAFGEIKETLTSQNGKPKPIQKLPISLAFDHRVADGAEAAKFVNTIKKYIKNPQLTIL